MKRLWKPWLDVAMPSTALKFTLVNDSSYLSRPLTSLSYLLDYFKADTFNLITMSEENSTLFHSTDPSGSIFTINKLQQPAIFSIRSTLPRQSPSNIIFVGEKQKWTNNNHSSGYWKMTFTSAEHGLLLNFSTRKQR